MTTDTHKRRVIAVQSAIAEYTDGKTSRARAERDLLRAGLEPDAIARLLNAAAKNMTGLMV